MATRSKIGVKTSNGILSVYCHWDGDPESMAPVLTTKYNTQETAEALVSKGSISSIDWPEDWDGKGRPPQPLYHYERGDGIATELYKRTDNFSECTRFEEYIYLFKNGRWYYKPATQTKWKEL